MRMKKVRVAVAGASGYAGGEILRLLLGHPGVEIGALTGASNAGQTLGSLQPHLQQLADRMLLATNPENLRGHDVVFLALPHGESAAIAAGLGTEVVVIDCGADFRLSDPTHWEQFYGGFHAGTWPYGVPELPGHRAQLAGAKRIAVAGCYPTVSTLALAPAVGAGLVETEDIVIVAASGTSGAGKAMKTNLLASEVMGGVSAYGVGGTHRHIPEIVQALAALTEQPVSVSFTPLLVPMPRGILATCSARLAPDTDAQALSEAYLAAYRDEPFVSILPTGSWPSTKSVLGSNTVQLQLTVDEAANRLVVVAAIDNLTKGTAGGAVQCLNLAVGFPEETGLPLTGMAP
ncbi:MAG TPA: N-acetyl-gamma-glutamyl-phosphate reductase [Marmoricola sp.]|nr:N-acetyl-gamma-glutamyl-phosphate reductase [Marmoricola sp.]HNI70315.1 N-acetyl-gamma-glutamyl-phosphate reductase [Marmoricola sp.]HNJ79633.1 N-acetyl-gamma-glutamyl-phosphate reductase [Marmoricola sp.]HNN47821.1 N-acetyl-gamma-glutamyl-phosphate reductase [Marmoricola sp.]